MQSFKSLLASKTVWSQIIGFAATAGALWGIDLSPAEQAEIVTLIVGAQSVAGIVFRKLATKQIG